MALGDDQEGSELKPECTQVAAWVWDALFPTASPIAGSSADQTFRHIEVLVQKDFQNQDIPHQVCYGIRPSDVLKGCSAWALEGDSAPGWIQKSCKHTQLPAGPCCCCQKQIRSHMGFCCCVSAYGLQKQGM